MFGAAPVMMPLLSKMARVPSRILAFCFTELDLERKNCMTSILWGALVIGRDSFSYSPGFRAMVDLVSYVPFRAEYVWGGVALTTGTLQFYAIHRGIFRLRKLITLFNCSQWLLFTMAVLRGNPHAPVLATFGLFAWSSAALYFQLSTGRRK